MRKAAAQREEEELQRETYAPPAHTELPSSDADIYSRTKQQQAQRLARFEQLRQEQEQRATQELKEFGFAPRINDYPRMRRTVEDLLAWKKDSDARRREEAKQGPQYPAAKATTEARKKDRKLPSKPAKGGRSPERRSPGKNIVAQKQGTGIKARKGDSFQQISFGMVDFLFGSPFDLFENSRPANFQSQDPRDRPPSSTKSEEQASEIEEHVPFGQFMSLMKPSFQMNSDSIRMMQERIANEGIVTSSRKQAVDSGRRKAKPATSNRGGSKRLPRPKKSKRSKREQPIRAMTTAFETPPTVETRNPKNYSLHYTKELKKAFLKGKFAD